MAVGFSLIPVSTSGVIRVAAASGSGPSGVADLRRGRGYCAGSWPDGDFRGIWEWCSPALRTGAGERARRAGGDRSDGGGRHGGHPSGPSSRPRRR